MLRMNHQSRAHCLAYGRVHGKWPSVLDQGPRVSPAAYQLLLAGSHKNSLYKMILKCASVFFVHSRSLGEHQTPKLELQTVWVFCKSSQSSRCRAIAPASGCICEIQ